MSHLLAESTYEDVLHYLKTNSTVLIPVGATEQHGSYLPLATDALLADHVATDCAEEMGRMVAPMIPFGWSPQHMGGAGTITLRSSTLSDLLLDVCESLAHHGFRRIVIVNGHRVANLPPLQIAASRASAQTKATVIVADIAYLANETYRRWMETDLGGPMGHGDNYETSHLLHCRPDLVHVERINSHDPLPNSSGFRNMSPFAKQSRAAWWPAHPELPSTLPHLADREWVSEAVGKELHETVVRDLCALVNEFESAPEFGALSGFSV